MRIFYRPSEDVQITHGIVQRPVSFLGRNR